MTRRKTGRAVAVLALALAAMLLPPAVLAVDGEGRCVDEASQHFLAGERAANYLIHGVRATIDVGQNGGHGFHMCTPAEGSVTDQNASVAQIALTERDGGPGFITFGIVMCDGPLNAPAFCEGYPGSKRYFAEWMNCTGLYPLGYGQLDLGPADAQGHVYQVLHNTANNHWTANLDGVILAVIATDVQVQCLDPDTEEINAWFQFETHDRGDGIGLTTNNTQIRAAATRSSVTGAWTSVGFGTSCTLTSPEINTTCSGSTMYGWTTGN